MQTVSPIYSAKLYPKHVFCGSTACKGVAALHPQGSTWEIIGHWFLFASFTRLLMQSHSRPNEVPLSERNRMLWRPRSEFASHTGRQSKESKELYFLLTPTEKDVRGRGESTGEIRRLLKKSRDPKQLRQTFQKAVQEGRIDASVVGAAMQRCGQGLWWKELLEIRESQEQMGIVLHCIQHNLLLHALASCLKCKRCSDSEMDVRKAHAFQMARTIWGHPFPSTVHDFNCALSSVLQLCVRVGSSEAFAWADELWNWSHTRPGYLSTRYKDGTLTWTICWHGVRVASGGWIPLSLEV